MIEYTSLRKKGIIFIPALLFIFACLTVNGQSESYYYFYRVYFRDKGPKITFNYSAADLLSQRALDRREKAGIQYLITGIILSGFLT